jgi:anthranilate/para-aminobenzoate synthase component II
LFKNIPDPYSVVRYHSLIIDGLSLPKDLKVISTIADDPSIIMGVEHVSRPIYGVQFHPESIDTDHGMQLINNFLNI